MKILGIDYGTKRVGIALSDDNRKIAFPVSVLENNKDLIDSLKKIIEKEDVSEVVLGEPEKGDFKKDVLVFAENLKNEGLKVVLEKEFMTSLHTDMFTKTKPIARKTKQKRENKKDESAAALILQRYLDRQGMK